MAHNYIQEKAPHLPTAKPLAVSVAKQTARNKNFLIV